VIEEDLGTTCATAAEVGEKGREKKGDGPGKCQRKVPCVVGVGARCECVSVWPTVRGWPTDTAQGRPVERKSSHDAADDDDDNNNDDNDDNDNDSSDA
jgi:hypothetical protein